MKGKLIEFPEVILEALAEYKKLTGISASDYIRDCTCRRMVMDKILKLKSFYVETESSNNKKQAIKINTDAIESNKFCDGDKCELPIFKEKNIEVLDDHCPQVIIK